MIIELAWIFFLADPQRVDLVDEVYQIPAHEWRYIEVGLKQRQGEVSARFDAEPRARQVRLALMRRDDLERLRNGLAHGVMAVTEAAGSGRLDFAVPSPGDYVLVVDNQSRDEAKVHLRVWLQFAGRRGPKVTTLSPLRQFTVIVLSCAFFLGIVTFSARRLLRATKR